MLIELLSFVPSRALSTQVGARHIVFLCWKQGQEIGNTAVTL